MTKLMEEKRSGDVEAKGHWEWMKGAISDSKRDP